VARVGAFYNTHFVGINSNMDADLLFRKRLGIVSDSIRRNGDLAGAKARAR
jgi:hypothetical protein